MLLKDNNWLSGVHTESTTTDVPDSIQTCIYTWSTSLINFVC